MAETIESFVEKLQAQGVEAGRQQAEKIRQEAQKQAEQVVAEARQQAEKIVEDAKAQAKDLLDRAHGELRLAARDTVLKLRETLSKAVEAVLARGAKEKLEDVSFLGELLHELVELYCKSHLCDEGGRLEINVRPELKEKLKEWALSEVGQQDVDRLRHSFDLKGTLSAAGFEYNAGGATVEVTLDSVVETLKALVAPGLQEVLEEAIAQGEAPEGEQSTDES